MTADDITEFESQFSKGTLKVRIVELENGLLVFLSDSQKYRLGQSAMAIPPGQGRTEPTSAGVFTGGLDAALVRTLSERVSVITGQTCMVISGVRDLTRETMMEIMLILKNHLVA
ncbi:MAG: hypothetical protein ACFFD3_12645 [Candidatus Thorarchaeota archaeon]